MTETVDFEDVAFNDVEDEPPKPGRTSFFSRSKDDDKKSNKQKSKINTPPPGQAEKLCANLADMYRFAGMTVSMADQNCGRAIVQQADDLGNSWVELAKSSPSFRRFLARMQQASGIGTVLTAHVPLAMAVVSHHMPGLLGRTVETEDSDVEYSTTQ